MISARYKTWLNNLLGRAEVSEDTVLVTTALIIGVGVGIGSILLHYLIDGVAWIGFTWIPDHTNGLGQIHIILVPAFAGIIVGLLIYYFAHEAKGHGVPEVMEAVALKGGRIRPIVAIIKAVASALTIGSGGSAGREGPIVQIGSGLGSTLGQVLHLSDDRIRNLVACGAAAGIAAAFNAPIAGVIFALEIILGEFSVRYFSTVVLASVVASVIARAVFGDTPAFPLPVEYGVKTVWEYAFYPLLGLLAGVLGVVYVRVLYKTEDVFDAWKHVPEWTKPAIGGALLGALALAYPLLTGIEWSREPQIFGVGYSVIDATLRNQLALGTVLTLIVLKLIATSLTLGSGGSGGVFAPSLFMGAMLGAGFETILDNMFPGLVAPAGAYALVGMAAVFAASTHAPITAVLILTELTDDHRIVLPLMLTVIVATLVARIFLGKESIYTLKLVRRGINLEKGRDVDVLQGVLVEEAMTKNVHTVTVGMTLGEISDTFNYTHHHGFPVLDEQGDLWGIVTVADLDKALAKKMPRDTDIREFATPRPRLIVSFPDETIGNALARFGRYDLGRMPVVSREEPNRLLGMIRRADIISAYNVALTRRTQIQQHTELTMAQSPSGTEFVDVTLTKDSHAVGKAISDIAPTLPKECILVSIQRKGRLLIPHGNTVLQQDDLITAFMNSEDVDLLFDKLIG